MCVMSMVMDHYHEKWLPYVPTVPQPWITVTTPAVTPEEVNEFRKLLERAREYDRKHGEPDCELAEKKERLLKLADELGLKIDFV